MDTKNIDYLIETLLKERGGKIEIPQNDEDKRRLFRSLVNVREPKPIDVKFIEAQDAFLQAELCEKGITDIDGLQPIRNNLYLWRGDITTLKVDAIVNAANSGMLGCFSPCHDCIDNAIHTYAGVQLRQACAAIVQTQGHAESVGGAKITDAYNLPCKNILHTVGPTVCGGVTEQNRQDLKACYRSCLALAEQHRLKSVAFCCISMGVYRFPRAEAAKIAVDTVADFLTETQSDVKIVYNVYSERDYEVYKRQLITNN